MCCFKCVIAVDLNLRRRALLAEEVRDAIIRFHIAASFDRHGLKSGSAMEMKYLETAQRLQEGVLKKCHDEIVSTWENPWYLMGT
jgi:hypothetical protein